MVVVYRWIELRQLRRLSLRSAVDAFGVRAEDPEMIHLMNYLFWTIG